MALRAWALVSSRYLRCSGSPNDVVAMRLRPVVLLRRLLVRFVSPEPRLLLLGALDRVVAILDRPPR